MTTPRATATGLTDIVVPSCRGTDTSRTIPTAVGLGRRLDLPVRSFHYSPDGSTIAATELCRGSSTEERPVRGRGSCGGATVRWSSSLLVRLAGSRRNRLKSARRRLPLSDLPGAELVIGPMADLPSHDGWQRLVVPIDGSPETDALVPIAASWATAYGFELSLVGVLVPEPPPSRDDREPGRERFLVDPLGHLHHVIDAYGIAPTRPLVQVVADRLDASVAVAGHVRHEHSAVLLIPTTRQRTHWFRDDRSPRAFVKRSPAPVLTVHSSPRPVDSAAIASHP